MFGLVGMRMDVWFGVLMWDDVGVCVMLMWVCVLMLLWIFECVENVWWLCVMLEWLRYATACVATNATKFERAE